MNDFNGEMEDNQEAQELHSAEEFPLENAEEEEEEERDEEGEEEEDEDESEDIYQQAYEIAEFIKATCLKEYIKTNPPDFIQEEMDE